MIELTICHPPNPSFVLKGIDPSSSVAELKQLLAKELVVVEGKVDGVRLICAGRVLQDHLNLESQGVNNLSKIYISIPKVVTGSDFNVNRNNSSSNTDDPLMAPLLKFLAANPELYQQMLMSNPQMQKLIEKNPELGHALSDPSTLKSMLNAAANPKAYNEMLRGHDRAMSNLENIPEGFSHLKRIYSTLQEPMYNAFTPQQRNTIKKDTTSNTSSTSSNIIRKDPIPNPWSKQQKEQEEQKEQKEQKEHNPHNRHNPPVSPIFGFNSQKRRYPTVSSSSDDLDDFLLNSMQRAGLSSPQSRFFTELEAMHALGFTDDEGENIPALMETGGDVSAAIDRIISKRKK